MIKVSVVVPVYNAAKYLRQCIDSLLNQSLQDIEIICVDDGSTDDSPNILNEYAAQTDILVIRQENQGQGAARNKGVDLAKGQYVGFVDADDFVAPNMYQRLWEEVINKKPDIVVCRAYCVDEGNGVKSPLHIWNTLSGIYSLTDICNLNFFNNQCSPVLWDKLIRADIAKSNLSPSLHRGQDFITLIQYITNIRCIVFLPDRLYYYRRHDGSVMSTPISRRTIMDDFETEQMAVYKITQTFYKKPIFYHYIENITREWRQRLNESQKFLNQADIEVITRFIEHISSITQ